jgi:DNA-binding NarL/FixJ family response regulator
MHRAPEQYPTGMAPSTVPAARRSSAPSRPVAVRTVLADDAYLVREALKHLLEGTVSVVVGECGDAREVIRTIDEQRADLLITDIRMPPSGDDEGILLAAELRRSHPAVCVIVLSTYAEVAYALKLFEHGSDGRAYLLKDRIRDRRHLLAAIHAVLSGGSMTDPQIVEDLIRVRTGQASLLDGLTSRELDTLQLVAQGRSNASIAEALTLTKRAVEKHINSIFAKLHIDGPQQVSQRVTATLLYLAAQEETGNPPPP